MLRPRLTVLVLVLAGAMTYLHMTYAQSASDCTGAGTGAAVATSPTPRVKFQPSPDHAAVIPGTSTPLLTTYAIAVCEGTTLKQQATLGKPAPVSGEIVLPIPSPDTLQAQTLYYVIVYAVGPNGSSKAAPSNPFVIAGPPAAPGQVEVLP